MDQQASDQTSSGCNPPVWSLLDRNDPAWKALYSLYNPDNVKGKASGVQYSLQNRQAIQDKVTTRAAAAAASAAKQRVQQQQQQKQPNSKKKVPVPRFKQQIPEVVDHLATVPRRRPGQLIKAAMEAEAQQSWGQLPQPVGRLIDEQEKQRCALLMQFKGKIPCASQLTPSGRAKVAAAALVGQSCSTASLQGGAGHVEDLLQQQRAALQQRFKEAEQELAEREEFVESMQRLGGLKPDQMTAMRAEAAAKVQEMRQLDAQIRALDAQLQQQTT